MTGGPGVTGGQAFRDRTFREYVDLLGSTGSAPYGGAVAACCAAQAAALALAVARYALGSDGRGDTGAYAALTALVGRSQALVDEAPDLVDRDTAPPGARVATPPGGVAG